MSLRPAESRCSSPAPFSRSIFIRAPPGGRLIVDEKSVKLPFEFIPSRFKGREERYFQPMEEELERIQTALCPDEHDIQIPTHRAVSVTGLGGVGKTELVYRYLTRFGYQFGAIFFVTADSESHLRQQYSAISFELGLVDSVDRSDAEMCSETFRYWLSDPVIGVPKSQEINATVEWLLVFDDVEHPDILERFLPAGNKGSIITTSRNPLSPYGIEIMESLRLEGLAIPGAVQLLKTCARDESEDDPEPEKDATTIAEWVEGFPLALEKLGDIIYGNYLTISQFRRTHPTKSSVFKRLFKTISTAWNLEKLREDDWEAFLLLCLVSFLDPERIENSMLIPRPIHPDESISSWRLSEYISARKTLADTSLITVDRVTGDVRAHRLVQEVTKDFVVRTSRAASTFQIAVGHVTDQWHSLNRSYVSGSATKVDRWEKCRRVYPHILRLREVYEELKQLNVSSLEGSHLAGLLVGAAQYRLECGVAHEAKPLLDTAESIYQDSLDLEARAQLYRGRIALAASSKNGDDLLYHAQSAFDIERERHQRIGSLSPILAVACDDVAIGWAYLRNWNNAIEFLSESRKILECLPDFTRDMLFSPLYHLALVYQHQHRYDEAENILNEAIEDRAEDSGSSDKESIRSAALLYARGNVRFGRADRKRGDIISSLEDFEEAARRATRSVGAMNRATLSCQYQVARVSMKLGDYQTAYDLLDMILTHSPDHSVYERDTCRAAYLFSCCLGVQGKKDESDKWSLKSLEIHNRLRPQQHRTVVTLSSSDIDNLIPYDYLCAEFTEGSYVGPKQVNY